MRLNFVVTVALLVSTLNSFPNTLSASANALSNGIPQVSSTFFSDDFEAATLASSWTPSSTGNGVTELTTTYRHNGTHSVFLGQKVAGNASAALVLALDLSGQSDVFLDFWARATGNDAYRSVSISADGGASWKPIQELNDASQTFSHQVLDIASIAAANGLTLNNQFRIRFYYGSYTAKASDGLVIDDLRLAQRVQEVLSFPYAQDTFEAATFQQGLYPVSTLNGVAEINSISAHSGVQSVFLGQKVAGNASAALVLALDLSGQSDVFLDFWARATGNDAYRSVSISADGGASWKIIQELNDASQTFSHQVLDIASIAAANGLTLNNQFRIRFYYGSYTAKASDGLVIDDLRLAQRVQAITTFPFGPETFEAGTIQQGLYPQSTLGGVAEINTNYPHGGTKSFFLGQKVSGNASASLVLALDLSGQSDVLLDFWARATGSSAYRSVSISDDGGANWKLILDLEALPQSFSHQSLNIAGAALANGLTLNNQFRIRFYYGSYTAKASDGLVMDDIKLVRTSISGKVYNEAATKGNEVAGALVEICAAGTCQTIATNSDGSYQFGDLAPGSYSLRALPPAQNTHLIGKLGPIALSANTALADQNIILPKADGIPAGTAIKPSIQAIDGVPSIFWTTPVMLTQKSCAGGTASYKIYADGVVVRSGTMAEAPAGNYSTQIAALFPLHGVVRVEVNVQCVNAPVLSIDFNIWIDPSGLVVNTHGRPIADAKVSLYRADTADGSFDLVASGSAVMSPANRINPMQTDSNGSFGWDVIAGYYRVRAEKAGCTAPGSSQNYNETAVLTIPPPVSNLRIVLFCGESQQVFLPMVGR